LWRGIWLMERFHLDTPLLLALLSAAALGPLVLYSAGRENLELVRWQALWLRLGF